MKNKKIIIISKPNTPLSLRTKFLINIFHKICGYDYEIVYPSDECRGRRANIIEWYDEEEDVFKKCNLGLDKPLK